MRTPVLAARRLVVATAAAAGLLATMVAGAIPALADPDDPVPTSADDKFTAEAMETLSEEKTADFWVRFADRADLTDAAAISDWDARGVAVYEALKQTAAASQAATIETLEAAGVDYSAKWATNAIIVRDGTLDLARELATSNEVLEIRETVVYDLIEPINRMATSDSTPDAVEWGVQAINADDVWDLGITGEGITVANIDTGVQYDHPALVGQYRGNNGDGTFTHDYNWFDSSNSCSGAPCDTDGHGSHTMGTMIGDDGGSNQIGVAPGAQWIAANGCSTCSDEDLIDSGAWILAPTPVAGGDGDPTKRPNIVNNSWGSRLPSNDPFMEDVIADWEAAGIFGTWSNGNSGPACQTSGSPGSRTITYSVGGFDVNGNVYTNSGRGAGQDGTIKPNISAPAVNVRSSLPGNSYGTGTGTSMAAPHLAGAIALLWSAAPSLIGDIRGTWELLDETAVDVDDTTCGGTADDNNVWGEGKLDALALIQAAPIGDSGTLSGTVTDEAGDPVVGASVELEGPTARTLTTDDAGAFTAAVAAGDYTVTASAFGYQTGTQSVTVAAGGTATLEFVLATASNFGVSGTVTNTETGDPVAGATVSLGSPIESVTTDADGGYAFADVPAGSYTLSVTAGSCAAPYSAAVTVDGDETFDVALEPVYDDFGYYCTIGSGDYLQGEDLFALTGDEATARLDLPFSFSFYGESYDTVYLSTNGHLNFLAPITAFTNAQIPVTANPNAAIYPFWDDLQLDSESGVYTSETEVDGQAAFVIEYRNAKFFGTGNTQRMNFSATLLAGGGVIFGYGDLTEGDARAAGNSATVGIENETGTVASLYSFNTESLEPGLSIRYTLPPHGYVWGTITDFNDTLPIAGATVTATPSDGGEPVVVQTADDGSYEAMLFFGSYTVEITAPGYQSKTKDIVIDRADERNKWSPKLKTGIADVSPSSFDWVLTEGESRTAELTISNSGSRPLDYTIGEVSRAANATTSAPALSMGATSPGITNAFTLDEAEASVAELEQAKAEVDTEARTALGLYTDAQTDALAGVTVTPDAAGDVLAQWNSGLPGVAWGVGYTGDVWLSDADAITNNQFTTSGSLQHSYPANWGGTWNGDLALDSSTGDVCQVNVGGDNAIVCFDPATGQETSRLTGSPWSNISQRGLAYNPVDDVFYTGGWNEGIIYTVAGFSHATPGEMLASCTPADASIAGIAYNPTSDTIWFVNSASETWLYQISPDDCSTISTVAFPDTDPGPGAGLDMDSTGALWAADQLTGDVYLIDVGDPAVSDVSWLSITPNEGRVKVGKTASLDVTVDTTGLEPGVYGANILVQTSAGRVPTVTIPVTLVVSAYQVGVNVGGEEYTDANEFTWSADQSLAGNDWGYMGQRVSVETTSEDIGGTTEDTLFQSRRTGIFSYVFFDAPAGTYEIQLDFAEFDEWYGERDRVFDVLVDGEYQLIAHDVAEEAGGLWADQHTVVVDHPGGDLVIQFLNRRSYDYPIVNALSVTERADRTAG